MEIIIDGNEKPKKENRDIIEMLIIGKCKCGRQVLCHTNPYYTEPKNLFTGFIHLDGTKLCEVERNG